jgi:hypothetical protein
MQAVPLTGRDAEVATLRAKLSVAKLRAQYAVTRSQRDFEALQAARFRAQLRLLEEVA